MIRKALLALALLLGLTHLAHAEGLNADQMGDLILHGQMTGADGARRTRRTTAWNCLLRDGRVARTCW